MRARRLLTIFAIFIVVVLLEVVVLKQCVGGGQPAAPAVTPEATDMISTTFTPTPTAPPATDVPETVTPAPTEPPATDVPETATPSPTPTPEPTPTPTPEPTPTPIVGTVLNQGAFGSETGTSMNMNIVWKIIDNEDGTVRVAVSGTVSSYSLQVMANSVSITFGDYSASCTGRSINVAEGYAESALFSTVMTVPQGTEGNLTVVWNYNGTYGDVSLPTVEAAGYVIAG